MARCKRNNEIGEHTLYKMQLILIFKKQNGQFLLQFLTFCIPLHPKK